MKNSITNIRGLLKQTGVKICDTRVSAYLLTEKKVLLFLFAAVVGIFSMGCADDLGNYDYKPINELAISGIDELYTIEQSDLLKISPLIEQSLDQPEDDFEYVWYLYQPKALFQADTVSHEKNLNVRVSSVPANENYEAVLRVTNKKTGVFYKHRFQIKITSSFSNGLFVLSDVNGEANVAVYNSAGKLYQDIYKEVNGSVAGKNPLGLKYLNSKGFRHMLILCNDGQGGVYADNISFKKEFSYGEFFMLPPAENKPVDYITDRTSIDFVNNNGKLYFRRLTYMNQSEQKFGAFLHGDYKASEFSYVVGWNRVFYDDTKQRFFFANSLNNSILLLSDNADGAFNPANVGLEQVYGGIGFKQNGYGLFKDANKNLYALGFYLNNSGTTITPLFKVDVSNLENLKQASSYALSRLSPVLFYSSGNKIYSCTMESQTTKLVYTFPEGSTIDYIEYHRKSLKEGELFVGTTSAASQSDKKGSFHIFDVTSLGNLTHLHSLENVCGKVVDFQYK